MYASDLKEDGYSPGLMVCSKCYDPPHPQDYVRVAKDDLEPLYATGESEYDRTGVEGSDDVPATTLTGPTDDGWGEL